MTTIEKIVELYERLLTIEHQKVEHLESVLKKNNIGLLPYCIFVVRDFNLQVGIILLSQNWKVMVAGSLI